MPGPPEVEPPEEPPEEVVEDEDEKEGGVFGGLLPGGEAGFGLLGELPLLRELELERPLPPPPRGDIVFAI